MGQHLKVGCTFCLCLGLGARCDIISLTILKKFDPEPDLCPVNTVICIL